MDVGKQCRSRSDAADAAEVAERIVVEKFTRRKWVQRLLCIIGQSSIIGHFGYSVHLFDTLY